MPLYLLNLLKLEVMPLVLKVLIGELFVMFDRQS